MKKISGVIIGTVTCRKRAQAPAPSIAAASYSVSEMFWSPARNTTMLLPMLHSPMTTNTSFVTSGSKSQFRVGSPMAVSRLLISPKSDWNNISQRMDDATAGVIDGR